MSTLDLDVGRSAFLLLDYQNFNVHPDGYWSKAMPGSAERAAPAVERTRRALEASRAAGMMVIHVQTGRWNRRSASRSRSEAKKVRRNALRPRTASWLSASGR